MEIQMSKVSANGNRKVIHRRIKRLTEKYRSLFASTPRSSWNLILKDRYLSLEHDRAIRAIYHAY